MPRPTKVAKSAEYHAARLDSSESGERNDCTVIALSVAAGVAYDVAREALAAAGRKAGKGAAFMITRAALNSLGFEAETVATHTMLARYPNGGKGFKNLTTHQPDRFPAAWRDGNTYLMRTAGHILCIKDGVNHDWTRGSAKRAIWLYRVVPLAKAD